jgi:hypothetical protein
MVDGYVYSVEGRQTSELVISRSATPATGQTPVPDARVTITGSSQADFTNDQGYFKIGRVLPGTQTLTVSKPNYTTVTIEVRVVKGQTTHVSQFDRQWTLLIYLNADNNLETDGVDDVNEMEQVGSTEEVAIVVLMDRIRGTYPDDVSNGNWTDTRRFVVQKDDDTERMTSSEPASGAEILGEFDMGDPGTLKEFIEWGLANYPAEHYLLDIWNHGAGWRSRTQVAEATRGVSFDDTDGTSIETVELPFALNVNPLIDVTAFDSSLMQMMEVAYEIRNRTDLVVGS